MANQFWYCNVCHAQNHVIDGTCQYCECEGVHCQRDGCDGDHGDPAHRDRVHEGYCYDCQVWL